MYCLKNCDWNKLVFNNLTPNHKLRLIYIKDDDSEETLTFSNLESINVNNIKKIISAKVGHGKAWKNVTYHVNRLIGPEPVVYDDVYKDHHDEVFQSEPVVFDDGDNEVSQPDPDVVDDGDNEVSKPDPVVVKKKPSLHRCLDFNTYRTKYPRYTNYVFNTKSLKSI